MVFSDFSGFAWYCVPVPSAVPENILPDPARPGLALAWECSKTTFFHLHPRFLAGAGVPEYAKIQVFRGFPRVLRYFTCFPCVFSVFLVYFTCKSPVTMVSCVLGCSRKNFARACFPELGAGPGTLKNSIFPSRGMGVPRTRLPEPWCR